MKKNNGFTIVEVIVSFSLTMIIVLFLFQLIITLKQIYNNNFVASDLVLQQSNISQMINSDFLETDLGSATNVAESYNNGIYGRCYSLTFTNGVRKLCYDTEHNIISYNDYEFTLISGSKIGDVSVEIENGNLFVDIPITYSNIERNFDVTAVLMKRIDVVNNSVLVIFDANGGSVGIDSLNLTYGKPFNTLPIPTKIIYNDLAKTNIDYKFLGWYTSANGGNQVLENNIVNQMNSVTLYAHWQSNLCFKQTNVLFDNGTENYCSCAFTCTATNEEEAKSCSNSATQICTSCLKNCTTKAVNDYTPVECKISETIPGYGCGTLGTISYIHYS